MLRLKRDASAVSLGEQDDLAFGRDQAARTAPTLGISPASDAGFIAADHLGDDSGAAANFDNRSRRIKHAADDSAHIALRQSLLTCANRIFLLDP